MNSSLIGRKLGKYEITELIGRGGMATVYKGYQADIDRYVAIKVLHQYSAQDPQFIERFRLEARTIARLQHPHILPVYDYGDEDGIVYLAVAFVSGGALSDRIDRGPMPLADIERMMGQLASALDYAHRQNVIHRDIKPDNILLDSEGNALLADFGIVKLLEDDARLTVTGGLIGTPAYMAPEQATGHPVDSATDIYSLGVVAYEMLTGQQPYKADSPLQLALQHVTAPTPRVTAHRTDLPPALERVMLRVMAKDSADRYSTATAFTHDLSRAIQGTTPLEHFIEVNAGDRDQTLRLDAQPTNLPGPGSTTVPPTTTTIQTAPNNTVLLAGVGVIALLVVVIVALVLFALNQGNPIVILGGATDTPLPTVEAVVAAPTEVPQQTFGRLNFGVTSVDGDTVNLRVQGLRPAGAGRSYAVWLGSSTTGDTLALGALSLDALGEGILSYTDSESRVLPTIYDQVMITLEDNISGEPAGDVRYSGSVPAQVGVALREILLESEAGWEGGSLLAGALDEADFGDQHAQLAARAASVGGMHTHAEHTINILLGTDVDYNGDGRGENPGRGLGVLHFLDLIEQHLDEAINAPGATRRLQIDAELIRVCVENARFWVDEVVALEQVMLAADDREAVETEAEASTEITHWLINGHDRNGNGIIEPFEGECGLEQIATFGVLVGGMDIVEGALE